MKQKLFITSDIHGCYDELIEALSKAGYDENNETHKLVVLGDCFDRGPDSFKLFTYLHRLTSEDKAIVTYGNHDNFILNIFQKVYKLVNYNMMYNGLDETVIDFLNNSRYKDEMLTKYDLLVETVSSCSKFSEEFGNLHDWLMERPVIFETKNYIMTHAGFNVELSLDEQRNDRTITWTDTPSFCSANLKKFDIDKQVILGHWHAEKIRKLYCDEFVNNENEIYTTPDNQKILIDSKVNASGFLNVLVLEDYLIAE